MKYSFLFHASIGLFIGGMAGNLSAADFIFSTDGSVAPNNPGWPTTDNFQDFIVEIDTTTDWNCVNQGDGNDFSDLVLSVSFTDVNGVSHGWDGTNNNYGFSSTYQESATAQTTFFNFIESAYTGAPNRQTVSFAVSWDAGAITDNGDGTKSWGSGPANGGTLVAEGTRSTECRILTNRLTGERSWVCPIQQITPLQSAGTSFQAPEPASALLVSIFAASCLLRRRRS